MFKNYVWLILAMLSCQGILQAEDNQDCGASTQDIMKFLAISGTKWWGNKEWIENIKKDVSIETNCLCVRNHDTIESDIWNVMQGVIVKVHDAVLYIFGRGDRDTVKAKFIITQKNDDFVTIKSLIEHTTVSRITEKQEIELIKSNKKVFEEQKKDDYSECDCKLIAEFNDSTNILKATEISSCTTGMPLDMFIKEIEKNQRKARRSSFLAILHKKYK